eukprot:6114593-Pyramimonas_sp.AAC.1
MGRTRNPRNGNDTKMTIGAGDGCKHGGATYQGDGGGIGAGRGRGSRRRRFDRELKTPRPGTPTYCKAHPKPVR